MRTQAEILSKVDTQGKEHFGNTLLRMEGQKALDNQKLIVEVLLDIRELLLNTRNK